MNIHLQVECNTTELAAKVSRLSCLLEGLPQSVRESLLERLANLPDEVVQLEAAEPPPAGGGDVRRFVFRPICPVLDELIAAAIRATNIEGRG